MVRILRHHDFNEAVPRLHQILELVPKRCVLVSMMIIIIMMMMIIATIAVFVFCWCSLVVCSPCVTIATTTSTTTPHATRD